MSPRVLRVIVVFVSIAAFGVPSALSGMGSGKIFPLVNGRWEAIARLALPYPWPIRPFDRQHPIRGGFGDPRTVIFRSASLAQLDWREAALPGAFSFHNGVDIVAHPMTPVYPVVDGIVREVRPDEVIVKSGEGKVRRSFQYWHIVPSVAVGDRVYAEATVLGRVQREARHVHLTEIRNGCVVDPLLPGHLTPYTDHTVPRVLRVEIRNADGRSIHPTAVSGVVDIVAEAIDEPPLAVLGAWHGMPVAPALLTWRLTNKNGDTAVPNRVAADFRFTLPPNSDFWQVYAQGTLQNFPVIGHRYFYGYHGRYLFNLADGQIDTRTLPDGVYILTVTASDVRGNSSSISVEVRIANRGTGLGSSAGITRLKRFDLARSGLRAGGGKEILRNRRPVSLRDYEVKRALDHESSGSSRPGARATRRTEDTPAPGLTRIAGSCRMEGVYRPFLQSPRQCDRFGGSTGRRFHE